MLFEYVSFMISNEFEIFPSMLSITVSCCFRYVIDKGEERCESKMFSPYICGAISSIRFIVTSNHRKSLQNQQVHQSSFLA